MEGVKQIIKFAPTVENHNGLNNMLEIEFARNSASE